MADKVTLISSIKKLISLNVSDEEIISNLEEVGISKEESKMLLKEAKDKVPEKIKSAKIVKKKPDFELRKAEEDERKKEAEEKKEKEELARQELMKAVRGTSEEKNEVKSAVEVKPPKKLHAGETEVWEKGVLTVVNERLDEIENIRDNINEVINEKIREELKKETKKLEEGIESKRQLMVDKINSSLETKTKEITATLDAKLVALKELKISVSKKSRESEEKEKQDEQVLAEIKTKLKEIESSKLGLTKALKNELEEMKNESKQFMFDSTKQIEELDERVNKALELESKITEGLITNAEKKIEEISKTHTESLSIQLTKKLAAFEELTKRMNPKKTEENIRKISSDFEVKISNTIMEKEKEIDEVIMEKIKEIELIKIKIEQDSPAKKLAEEVNMKLEAFRISLRKEIDDAVQELENTKVELKKFIAVQLAESSTNSESQLNDLFEQRKKELEGFQNKVLKATNLKDINQKVEELDEFKGQFVNTIRKNLDEMKTDKEELEVMIEEKEKEIDKKIEIIDTKIKELNEFEKAFAKEMGVKIQELTKAKTLKQEIVEREESKPKVKEQKTVIKEKKIKATTVSFKNKKGKTFSGVKGTR